MGDCMSCGRAFVAGVDRYCAGCGAMLPGTFQPAPPRPAPSPTFNDQFPNWRRYVIFSIVLMVVLGGIGVYLADRGQNLISAPVAADPLAGTVVFGDSFDSDLVLKGQRKTASLSETTVWVAHSREVQPKGTVMVSYVLDGTPLATVPMELDTDWTLAGATLSTFGASPGQVLLIRVTTVGNEQIAIGSVTIEP